MVGKGLLDNPSVQKALRRLKSFGLRAEVVPIREDYVIIGIEKDSVIRSVARYTDKSFLYPKKHIEIDNELGILVHIWKGETPPEVKERLMKVWERREG